MGYYTNYTLIVDNEDFENIIWLFREEYADAKYALDEDGSSSGETKWYSHKEELEKFSKGFPDVLFTLSGEGEETGDLWKLYVKNGKSQLENAIITYKPFDESKLL